MMRVATAAYPGAREQMAKIVNDATVLHRRGPQRGCGISIKTPEADRRSERASFALRAARPAAASIEVYRR